MSFLKLKIIKKIIISAILFVGLPLMCPPKKIGFVSPSAIVPYQSPYLSPGSSDSYGYDSSPYVPSYRYVPARSTSPQMVLPAARYKAPIIKDQDAEEDGEADVDSGKFSVEEAQRVAYTLARWERSVNIDAAEFMDSVNELISDEYDFNEFPADLKLRLLLVLLRLDETINRFKQSEDDERFNLSLSAIQKVKNKWSEFYKRVKAKYILTGWPVANVSDKKTSELKKNGEFQVRLSVLQEAVFRGRESIHVLVNFARIFASGQMTPKYFADLVEALEESVFPDENWAFVAYNFLNCVIGELKTIQRLKEEQDDTIAGQIDKLNAFCNQLKDSLRIESENKSESNPEKYRFFHVSSTDRLAEVSKLKDGVLAILDDIEKNTLEIAKTAVLSDIKKRPQLEIFKVLRLFYVFNQLLLTPESSWIVSNTASIRNMFRRMYGIYDSVLKLSDRALGAEFLPLFIEQLVQSIFLLDACRPTTTAFEKVLPPELLQENGLKEKYARFFDDLCTPQVFTSPVADALRVSKLFPYLDFTSDAVSLDFKNVDTFTRMLWSFFPYVPFKNDVGAPEDKRALQVLVDPVVFLQPSWRSDLPHKRAPANFVLDRYKLSLAEGKSAVTSETVIEDFEKVNFAGADPEELYATLDADRTSLIGLLAPREFFKWKAIDNLQTFSTNLVGFLCKIDMLHAHSPHKNYELESFWNQVLERLQKNYIDKMSSFKLYDEEMFYDKRTKKQKQFVKDAANTIKYLIKNILTDFFSFKASELISEKLVQNVDVVAGNLSQKTTISGKLIEKTNKLYQLISGKKRKLLVGKILIQKRTEAERQLLFKIKSMLHAPVGVATLKSLFSVTVDGVGSSKQTIANDMFDLGFESEMLELLDAPKDVEKMEQDLLFEWDLLLTDFFNSSSKVLDALEKKFIIKRAFGLSISDLRSRHQKIKKQLTRYDGSSGVKPFEYKLPGMEDSFRSITWINQYFRLQNQLKMFVMDNEPQAWFRDLKRGIAPDGSYSYPTTPDRISFKNEVPKLKRYVCDFAVLFTIPGFRKFSKIVPDKVINTNIINYIAVLLFDEIRSDLNQTWVKLYAAVVRMLSSLLIDTSSSAVLPIARAAIKGISEVAGADQLKLLIDQFNKENLPGTAQVKEYAPVPTPYS